MRIGIDCRMYSPKFTGIGRYVYELVQHLQKTDSTNEYYLFFNDPIYSEVTITQPNFHKVKVNAKHYSLAEQTKFLFILNSHKLDVMHFTHFNAPILYRRPSVVTIHDLTLHFFPGKKMTSFIHRAAYQLTIRAVTKHAQKVIAVSKNTAKDLQKVLNVPSSKIHVIYEGVGAEFQRLKNQDAIKPTLDKYQIDRPFLLYTGNWRSHKNIIGLIKAYKKIKRDYYNDIQLVITGAKDNVYANDIYRTARNHLTNYNVVFPGLVPEKELIELINAATIYVFPSFYEGFGLPPLEAMQCHTPVAASNTSCLPEICGDAAEYFNPRSYKEMASVLRDMLNSPGRRYELIEKGVAHVQKFSWERMTELTHKLYDEIG